MRLADGAPAPRMWPAEAEAPSLACCAARSPERCPQIGSDGAGGAKERERQQQTCRPIMMMIIVHKADDDNNGSTWRPFRASKSTGRQQSCLGLGRGSCRCSQFWLRLRTRVGAPCDRPVSLAEGGRKPASRTDGHLMLGLALLLLLPHRLLRLQRPAHRPPQWPLLASRAPAVRPPARQLGPVNQAARPSERRPLGQAAAPNSGKCHSRMWAPSWRLCGPKRRKQSGT